MAGNTNCYQVRVGVDGVLETTVISFSPRYADTVDNALYRLRSGSQLQPPIVKFGDWQELQRRWDAREF